MLRRRHDTRIEDHFLALYWRAGTERKACLADRGEVVSEQTRQNETLLTLGTDDSFVGTGRKGWVQTLLYNYGSFLWRERL